MISPITFVKKMIRYLLLISFSFLTCFSFSQQDSSLLKHNTDSIIKQTVVKTGRYLSVVYTTGNNIVLSPKEIRDRLLSYQPSAKEFKKYKTARTNMFISGGAAITSLIVGDILYHNHNTKASQVCLYISGAFLITELFGFFAPKHLNKSIQLYNKQYL